MIFEWYGTDSKTDFLVKAGICPSFIVNTKAADGLAM